MLLFVTSQTQTAPVANPRASVKSNGSHLNHDAASNSVVTAEMTSTSIPNAAGGRLIEDWLLPLGEPLKITNDKGEQLIASTTKSFRRDRLICQKAAIGNFGRLLEIFRAAE